VRESAESVAFYRGGAMERRIAGRFFDAVVKTMDDLIQWYQRLAAFQIIVQYITTVAPAVIVAPMYDLCGGSGVYMVDTGVGGGRHTLPSPALTHCVSLLRYFSGAVEFGSIAQAGMAFRVIQVAMVYVVQEQEPISLVTAAAQRLLHLTNALDNLAGQPTGSSSQRRGGDGGGVDTVLDTVLGHNSVVLEIIPEDESSGHCSRHGGGSGSGRSSGRGNGGKAGASPEPPASFLLVRICDLPLPWCAYSHDGSLCQRWMCSVKIDIHSVSEY